MEIVFLLILFGIGQLLKANAEKKRRGQLDHELDLEEAAPERDDLMEEIRRAMEGMRQQREGGAAGRPGSGSAQLPTQYRGDDSFDEEDETLEETPVVRSLEDDFQRPERVLVDYDEESEAVVQRRIEWAEVRTRAHRPDDHKAFDRRIRAEPPVVPPPAAPTAGRPDLKQLIVWQEILGKPVALRNREDA